MFGFKCFLLPSGVDEFPHLDPARLAEAMDELARFDGLLIVHAEDPRLIEGAPQRGGPKYADFLASRPPAAEDRAVAGLIALAAERGARVHILHLSSASALPLIAAARRDGVRLTVETCPHFLTLTAEEVPDGATEFKCCPPIREAANQDALWQALADGTIDCVVSDHSPSTIDLKHKDTGDFAAAWGGISSLQLGLPAVWTEARRRGHTLADVAGWMSAGPAGLAGLTAKGAVAEGRDADFAVLAPEETFTVDPARLHHRNPITAYAGRTLHGVVRATYLRGRLVAGTAPRWRRIPPAGSSNGRPAGVPGERRRAGRRRTGSGRAAHPAAVRGDQVRVAPAAALDGPLLRRVVDVHQAEPLVVAVRPLEVVQQRPGEVAGQRRAALDRAGAGGQVLLQVLRPAPGRATSPSAPTTSR